MPISFTASKDPFEAPVLAIRAGGSRVEVDAAFLEAVGFEGKVGQAQTLPADDGGIVVVLGFGDGAKVTAETFRRAGAALTKAAWRATDVAVDVLDALPDGLDAPTAARAFAEGVALAAYRFETYKSDGKPCRIKRVTVVGGPPARVQTALDRAAVVVDAVMLARDLVNEPAASVTPKRLAEVAAEVAKRGGLEVRILDEKAMRAERLGAILGVAQGSDEPPRLIELVYEPEGRARGHVALVGKGITFDSGGLSIKTADGMTTMKTDMGGGAAVIAAMGALRALGVRTKVTAYVPATENMPGGRAVKPGDVLRARNGKTIEVLNTDAEGRLVLADALSLAVEAQPDAIVDIATLTGAQVVALGKRIAALMGTDDALLEQVQSAAERAGEPMWPMPLPDDYRSHIDSEVADIKNTGVTGQAGTLAGGLFLKEFTADIPWAHIDIAGPARADKDDGYLTQGGTGYGVRTLIEFVAGFERVSRRR